MIDWHSSHSNRVRDGGNRVRDGGNRLRDVLFYQQRGKALLAIPDVLILGEVCSNIDAQTTNEINC